jgi:iron complex outermembrane recepter protein
VSYLSQATEYGPGFAPRWKGTAGITWSTALASATLTERYVGSYRDYQDFVPNDNELGNTWFMDAHVRYELGHGGLSHYVMLNHFYVEAGGTNLMNRLPRYSYYGITGYDPAESDIRGRFLYVGVGTRW